MSLSVNSRLDIRFLFSQNLLGQRVQRIGVNGLQSYLLWFQIQQELHIGRQREQLALTSDVIITKLDDVFDVILFMMFICTFASPFV